MRPMTELERMIANGIDGAYEFTDEMKDLQISWLDTALEYWIMCEELRPTVRWMRFPSGKWYRAFMSNIDDKVEGIDG